jgi:D-psicose/D-tagatose/L-ribulose 3-epimerase
LNPLGIHALVWTGGWDEPDARLAISQTKSLGYDFVEIPLLDPSGTDPDMTRRTLDEYELGATCSLGLSFTADISSEDPETAARGEALLADAVAVCRDVGSPYLGGVIYSAMGKYMRPATEAGRAQCFERLARIADRAAASGIKVGIEPVNRYESNLVNNADTAIAMIEAVGATNLVVHLDSYHMNIEEGDLAAPVLRAAERLGYVHIGESHRGYLGSGSIDFGRLFRALAYIDYSGPIAFESFSSNVVSEDFCSALGVWRDLWDDGRDLAAHAKAFIGEQLIAARRSSWAGGGVT